MRDERITFQEKTVSVDANTNEPTETWTDKDTMWAKAIPRTANEDFRGDQRSGFQRYDWNILHRDDLSVMMRVKWDSRYWDIKAIEPLHKADRRKEMLITTEWREGQYS